MREREGRWTETGDLSRRTVAPPPPRMKPSTVVSISGNSPSRPSITPRTSTSCATTSEGSSDRGQHSSLPVHGKDVDNDGEDVENIVASSSEEDVISSSEDEDLYIPRHAHIFNHVLEESTTETPQAEGDNEMQTPQMEEEMNDGGVSKKRKTGRRGGMTRGRNKCKEIVKLKPGEKLPIQFYNNRAVGDNYDVFVKHLGIIVRDTNMCPLRIHRWKDIEDRQLEHMWLAVTSVFSNDDMEVYREHVLKHMHELWVNWTMDLKRYNITKPKMSLQQAWIICLMDLIRQSGSGS